MSREERAARREVDDAIGAADAHFSKVLDADLEDLKVEAQQQENEGADAMNDIAENEMEVDDEDDDSENGDAADEGRRPVRAQRTEHARREQGKDGAEYVPENCSHPECRGGRIRVDILLCCARISSGLCFGLGREECSPTR